MPDILFSEYDRGLIIQAGLEPDPHNLPIFDPAIGWMIGSGAPVPPTVRDDACSPAPPAPGPTDYPQMVAVAAVLKPIRVNSISYSGGLHAGGPVTMPQLTGEYMDPERTQAWMGRYDQPSPWDRFRIKTVAQVEMLQRAARERQNLLDQLSDFFK